VTKIAIVSGREYSMHLSEYCARDFEDAITESTEATLICPTPTSTQKSACSADIAIVVGITFDRLAKLLQATEFAPDCKVVAYVFGAYQYATNRPRNPIRKWRKRNWYGAFAKLDCLYLGFDVWSDEISHDLNVKTAYLPMAANVLTVNASPYAGDDRPIAVAAFGRQHQPTVAALSDALNRHESSDFFYYPSFLDARGANDSKRYRDMFWQALRQSKVSLAYDHYAAPNINGARCSYVGPRWFESLAAGTVVAGIAPQSDDCAVLLDWPNATIDLPEDPDASVEAIQGILTDGDFIREVSARNLVEMNKRHDWRHRLATILANDGFALPAFLSEQLEILAERSGSFQR
jgi:hypothetical protein